MSQHPTDRLIHDLIATRHMATDDEIAEIIARIASAPFDPRVVPVKPEYRGLTYLGRVLGEREATLFWHLVRRVRTDRQWVEGTTEDQYLLDIRQALTNPVARVLVYERRGGPIAAILAPNTVPPSRLSAKSEPLFVVPHSADRSTILSGYQTRGVSELRIPGEARWLR